MVLRGTHAAARVRRLLLSDNCTLFHSLLRGETSINDLPEIAKCFGSDASTGGIRFQFDTRFRQDAKVINDARARGLDIQDITLPSLAKKPKGEKSEGRSG
jgi:hypothetical protein